MITAALEIFSKRVFLAHSQSEYSGSMSMATGTLRNDTFTGVSDASCSRIAASPLTSELAVDQGELPGGRGLPARMP